MPKILSPSQILPVVATITIKKSKFIAQLFSITTPLQAKQKIKEQKSLYKDARHIVHAFIIGKKQEILGSSDAGEPPGTAGRPILSVLQGADVTDTLCTVTRYFGGVLLGTGGLVKAYTQATKLVIDVAQWQMLKQTQNLDFFVPYVYYEKTKRFLQKQNVSITKENYKEQGVQVYIQGVQEQKQSLIENLKDITQGKLTLYLADE